MKYLVTSDIHLAHRKTPSSHIADSIRKCILTKVNKDIKVLFIAGDLLDRLIEPNTKEMLVIIEVFDQILTYCFVNNIKLRILEGTPSHDWQQSHILEKLNNIRVEDKVDCKYFKNLDIEYMVEENKYILYIPDEWVNCHKELERQIQEKLNEHGITKVDIGILHGQFEYQFAGFPYKGFFFKANYFLKLVKGFIHVGHYHTYNPQGRILPNGSLERLGHRNEEDKGHVVVIGDSYQFIKNPYAYIYKTIPITKNTTYMDLDKRINKYHKEAYIRLRMSRDHPFNINFQDVKLRYLDYNLEKLIKDESESKSSTDIINDGDLELMDSFTINTDIKETLRKLVEHKYNLTPTELVRFNKHITIFDNLETKVNV